MADMMNMDDGGWDESMYDDIAGEQTELLKKVIFVIDRSGSMDGTTIGTINSVMEELLSELDADNIRVAAVEVDENVTWKTEVPVQTSQLGIWERTKSGSFSNLGMAFEQLIQKLEQKSWKELGKDGSEYYFVLFSDGFATDKYETAMNKLEKLPEFKSAKRLAINFQKIGNWKLLIQFAGDKKQVIEAVGSGAIDRVENAVLQMLK